MNLIILLDAPANKHCVSAVFTKKILSVGVVQLLDTVKRGGLIIRLDRTREFFLFVRPDSGEKCCLCPYLRLKNNDTNGVCVSLA